MITQMKRMDVVTNNIANVDTTGYKRDQVVSHSFTQELMRRLDDPGMRMFHDYPIGQVSQGVFVDDVYTDFTNGSLIRTGGALDIAIVGEGFLSVMVDTPNGPQEMYTRDGNLTLRADGMLITSDGGMVLGAQGPIMLSGIVVIDEHGRVYANEEYVDILRMVDFEDKHTLRKQADNYFTLTADSVAVPFAGVIQQGFVENSNVNTVREMVELIALHRAYEINSRMIAIHDATLGRAVNDIARK
jgi:flagellar basal-body rod protein FlgG